MATLQRHEDGAWPCFCTALVVVFQGRASYTARSVSAIGSNIGGLVDLRIGSSWGLAAQAGLSYKINDRWSAQVSVATFRVKSRLTVHAGGLERSVTMRMNPVAAAAALNYSF